MFQPRRRVVGVGDHRPPHLLSTSQHNNTRRRRRQSRHGHGFLRRGLSVILTSAMIHHARAQDSGGIPGPNETYVPLRVTNNCPDTIWPGIGTQGGLGPGLGGFELVPGETMAFLVGPTWQGRVWGRTNCTFNANGTGPSNLNGWNGNGQACMTGDCFGVLNCEFSVSPPPPAVSHPRCLCPPILTAATGRNPDNPSRIQPPRRLRQQPDLLRHQPRRRLQPTAGDYLHPGRQHLGHPAEPHQPRMRRHGGLPLAPR